MDKRELYAAAVSDDCGIPQVTIHPPRGLMRTPIPPMVPLQALFPWRERNLNKEHSATCYS